MGRSYGDFQVGQQRYAVIEFCTNAANLWGKIASGQYDWLGMKDDRTFVVGRPPVGGSRARLSGTSSAPDTDGRHRVEVRVPDYSPPTVTLHPDPEAARADFASTVKRLEAPDGSSGLWSVRLIIDRALVSEEFVVRRMRNYYGGM